MTQITAGLKIDKTYFEMTETVMLDLLKEKNKNLKIHSVDSDEFRTFGRIIKNVDTKDIQEVAFKIENPQSGASYLPSVAEFEHLEISATIRNEYFADMPCQVGYCWGHNNFLNATEWHTSSEINIAITPLVMFLGHIWDISDGKINSSDFTVFYLPKGTVVEIYATTLHFCPCEVSESGFGCVVALPEGTNTNLDIKPMNSKIFRKNKWTIAHVDNKGLIEKGVIPSITGENYRIHY